MKRFILTLALLLTAAPAWAQCNGVFATGQVCGNATGANAPARPTVSTAFPPVSAALTRTNDTNVTLTLTGTPATALLQAVGVTAGWTGQLSVARGGTGLSAGTSGGIPYFNSTSTMASSGALGSGQLVLGGGAGASPTVLSCATATTLLHGGAPPTCTQLAYADIASSALATATEYYAATASKLVSAAVIYPSEVTITYGSTTTVDFDTLINGVVTLTANITTLTLSNVRAGKAGQIRFIQSGAGSFTWPAGGNTIFKYAGGTLPALTTGSTTAVDVLAYSCSTTTFCTASLIKDVKNP